jgi:hypothetical protein
VQAEPREAIVKTDQLDIPAVTFHVRPHSFERLSQSRLKADRMKAMNEEKAADKLILKQNIIGILASDAGIFHELENPRQAVAMKCQDGVNTVLGQDTGGAIGQTIDLFNQLLDAFPMRSGLVDQLPRAEAGVRRLNLARGLKFSLNGGFVHGSFGSSVISEQIESS